MKKLPALTVLCSTLSLFACGGGGDDSSSFQFTDANVKEFLDDSSDLSALEPFFNYSFSVEESLPVTPKQLRKLVNKTFTKQCESGHLKSELSYDDEAMTTARTFKLTYEQCELKGDTLNGTYFINIEGDNPTISTSTIDLSTTTITIQGNTIVIEDQLENDKCSVNLEYRSKKYGQYSLHETTNTNQGVETGEGMATFANDSISWVYVDNGLDVTLTSTGTTQFMSLDMFN